MLALSLVSIGCDSDDQASMDCWPLTTPPCVQEMIALAALVDKSETWYIRTQVVDNELFYFLDSGASNVGGGDRIVDCDCDTVCTVGGTDTPQECERLYDPELWVVFWQG